MRAVVVATIELLLSQQKERACGFEDALKRAGAGADPFWLSAADGSF